MNKHIQLAITTLERSKGDDYYRAKAAYGENHPITRGYREIEKEINEAIQYLKTL